MDDKIIIVDGKPVSRAQLLEWLGSDVDDERLVQVFKQVLTAEAVDAIINSDD